MQNDKAHIEAKAHYKFASLYLECPISYNDDLGNKQTDILRWYHLDWLGSQKKEIVLLLRTVKRLTDEEIIQVVILMGIYEPQYKFAIQYYRDVVNDYFKGGITHCWHPYKHSSIVDYLRSISILLPITMVVNGEVKTYEVEEILSKNWAQIQKD